MAFVAALLLASVSCALLGVAAESSRVVLDAETIASAACASTDLSCEQASLQSGYAVFGACAKKSMCMHHQLLSLALPRFDNPTVGAIQSSGNWAVDILVKGDFSLEKCGAGTAECDLAVGLSDGSTVLAGSRGYDFEDTLKPFRSTGPTRSLAPNAYDTMRNGGPNVGDWRARIEVRGGRSTRARVWSVGNPPPTGWGGGGYACSAYPCPLAGNGVMLKDLELVMYRDDPPQRYWIEKVELVFATLSEDGGDPSAADQSISVEITVAVLFMVLALAGVALCVGGAFLGTIFFVARRRRYDEGMRGLSSELASITFDDGSTGANFSGDIFDGADADYGQLGNGEEDLL